MHLDYLDLSVTYLASGVQATCPWCSINTAD